MRKTKKTSPVALKANSLSELRGLQRQASQQAADRHAGHSADSGHGSPGDQAMPGARPRRRPHRFLPPGPGPVTATSARAQSVVLPDHDGKPDAQVQPPDHRAPRGIPDSAQRSSSGPVNPRLDSTPPDSYTPAAAPRTQGQVIQTAADMPEHQLDDSDIELFRRVVQSVIPATTSNRVLLPPEPPATPIQLRQRREHAMGQRITPALDVSDQYASVGIDHDDTVFLQTGQGPHLIKGLKKGKWPVQASLDLHGSTLDHARERMDRFIQTCRDHQIRCVRVVHGKGYGSKNGDPVLKETVRRWLSQLAVVQAYIECNEADGGAGAVLVLLSKSVP